MYREKSTTEKGITLVALVITIIVLVILATVSINAVIGENGLIQSAKNSKDSAENAVAQETGKMNLLLTEYANIMSEDAEITQPGEGGENPNPGGGEEEPEEPQPGDPIDGTLAVGPQVADGMTPVKYVNGTGWVKTTAVDEEWYNYGEKKWANVVLGGASFTTSGSYEVLNESASYSMLVWIPRYAYKITSMYHQSGSGGGNIDIVFLNTANEDKEENSYSGKTAYPSASTGSGMTDYVVHPAFNWGGVPLAGFWVGKFETSSNGGQIQIKGGVSSWRSISVNDMHNTCVGMNNSGNSYGLSSNDNEVDPHMMKNSEWGAVAYLAKSKYGKNSEVTINSDSNFYTGGGSGTSYRTNVGQSTTGDVTGIYDMSGGAWEYVAGYYGNGGSYASSLVNADARYKDIYSSSYQASTSGGPYGDAVWETSSSNSGSNSWYSDHSYFPNSLGPFFIRSGAYNDGSYAGLFFFYTSNGNGGNRSSFRVVVPVL